jgi:PrgI family protein/TraC protein
MAVVKVPSDVELEDRLAFGLTGKQLALLAATAVSAYGAYLILDPFLPGPVALAAMLIVAAAGIMLALVRHDGLPGDQLALAILRYTLAPKRRLLAPDGIPPPLPGSPQQPRVSPLDIPIHRVLTSGVVQLTDESHCLLLDAHGSSFELRSPTEQEAFVAAFQRFLNSRSDPIQITIQSEPTSLNPQAERLEHAAAQAPPPLRNAALDHASFLRSLTEQQPLLRRRVLLILRSRERDSDLATVTLTRLAQEAVELLQGADVTLHTLDGEQATALLARSLDPPGPPDGTHLTGVIHAKPLPSNDQTHDAGGRPVRSGAARSRSRPRRPAVAADVRDHRLPA